MWYEARYIFQLWNLKSLGNEAACFKNPNNSSSIDLLLTNTIRSFQQSQAFETGLSDFHKLVVTVLKSTFPKSPPQKVTYRSYKNCSNDLLRDEFKNYLLSKQNMTLEFTSLTSFTKIFIETMNKHAPIKKNILAQTTQTLLQKAYGAIMLRCRLRNIFLKEKYLKSEKAYNRQCNICAKMAKKT